jgi:hypothetical protein
MSLLGIAGCARMTGMCHQARAPHGVRLRARFVIGAVLTAVVGCHREPVRPPEQFPPALQGFMVRTQAYAEQRRQIAARLPQLSANANADEIKAHEQALIDALTAARTSARQGDVIDREAATALRHILRETPQTVLRELHTSSDGETPVALRVNAVYPDSAPVKTMPASLLHRLPPLPQELQFRVIGSALALLDWESRLIVDFVPDALGP